MINTVRIHGIYTAFARQWTASMVGDELYCVVLAEAIAELAERAR